MKSLSKNILILSIAILFSTSLALPQTNRTVAVTFDDLPTVSQFGELAVRQQITKDLLAHVTKAGVPAIGFVNERKLYKDDKLIDSEVALLQQWIDAGLELGNHTYSHRSLHNIPLEDYLADIAKGEPITDKLLRNAGMKLRYFRHPFLHTGLTIETKSGVSKYLKEHGYTIAPVSIDNADYIFAAAYDKAKIKGDEALRKRIAEAYIPYMEAKTEYWERQSVRLFGREIAQTLLIHANSINAELFGDLAKMFKNRGYEFVTLEEALKDEAYRLPDEFTGRAGISWIHRWVLARDRSLLVEDEPFVPEFVMEASGFDSQ
ncbi:MAG: polysaccharide deacetylase [Acidobacteria bacterium]|nr:MAG: polysaccharide deacetylase [Acidobacteriota bacterium]REK02420.1 MAG: polysaccharide deacetylase [Acidobacteriota bacterium]REK13779.1 MAG: polysaccharide deacetylase [Acidobacteriota bacterium]REK41773.1 MAG: polysaccharide deacetylase [Acidobacteriota bacterium]